MDDFKKSFIFHSVLIEGQKQRIQLKLNKIIENFNREILNNIDFEKSPQSNNRLLIQILSEMYKELSVEFKNELKELLIYENEFYNLLLNNFVIEDKRAKKATKETQNNVLLAALFFGNTLNKQLKNQQVVNTVNSQGKVLNLFNQKKFLEEDKEKFSKQLKTTDDKIEKENIEKKISEIENKIKTNTDIKKEILNTSLAANSNQFKALIETGATSSINKLRDDINIENEVLFYQYVAVLDNRTSEICRDLNGNVYRVDNKNAPRPPQHFRCRSAIYPLNYRGNKLTANDDLAEFSKQFEGTFVDKDGNFKLSKQYIISLEKALELEKKRFNI